MILRYILQASCNKASAARFIAPTRFFRALKRLIVFFADTTWFFLCGRLFGFVIMNVVRRRVGSSLRRAPPSFRAVHRRKSPFSLRGRILEKNSVGQPRFSCRFHPFPILRRSKSLGGDCRHAEPGCGGGVVWRIDERLPRKRHLIRQTLRAYRSARPIGVQPVGVSSPASFIPGEGRVKPRRPPSGTARTMAWKPPSLDYGTRK